MMVHSPGVAQPHAQKLTGNEEPWLHQAFLRHICTWTRPLSDWRSHGHSTMNIGPSPDLEYTGWLWLWASPSPLETLIFRDWKIRCLDHILAKKGHQTVKPAEGTKTRDVTFISLWILRWVDSWYGFLRQSLIVEPRLASNPQFCSFDLPNAGILGVCYHTQIHKCFSEINNSYWFFQSIYNKDCS